MLPDRVWNPGPLTYESGAIPIALFSVKAYICMYATHLLNCLLRCLVSVTTLSQL